MKLIINRTSALVLAAICVNVLSICRYALAQDSASYPLYCHGPLHTVMSSDIYGSVYRTHFKWSRVGAGVESPGAGECAWADRGPRDIEIKPGAGNDICGDLGRVANLASGKYAEIGVFRNPHIDNCMEVTQVVGFVSPPFSPRPVLQASNAQWTICNYSAVPMISVAVAYLNEDGLVSQGWVNINKCACTPVSVVGHLRSHRGYLRVQDRNRATIQGNNFFCANPNPAMFSVLNNSNNLRACKTDHQGYPGVLGFADIVIDSTNTYVVGSPANCAAPL